MNSNHSSIREGTSGITLARVIELFSGQYRAQNLSERTIAWYRERLGYFIQWMEGQLGRPPTLGDFTPHNFQLFILEKQASRVWEGHPCHPKRERGPSSAYIHGFYRCVRAFGSWLDDQHLLSPNRMKDLPLPKLEEKELVPLTAEEEKRLLDAYDENTPLGSRAKAIFALMLDSGLRKAELVGLKFRNVYLDEGYLLVKGKGRKERWIPFGYKTGWLLQRYALLHRPEPATPSYDTFFLDPEGYPMTENGLKMLFARASKRTGIERLHPHLLRHTFGIRSQEIGMPSLTLQRYMGHSDVRTTERYAHAAQSEKIKRERGYSHLDRLDIKVKKTTKRMRV